MNEAIYGEDIVKMEQIHKTKGKKRHKVHWGARLLRQTI